MSALELVGASAIYIFAVFILGYAYIAIAASCSRGGLESIPTIIIPAIAIWIVGGVVGLVLLGATL